MAKVKIIKNDGFETLIIGKIYEAQILKAGYYKYKAYDGDGTYYFLPADYCEAVE